MSPHTQQKILVVEDEQDLQTLYTTILTGEGFAVDTASDGLQAYEKMKKGGYDLVLLDIMLPEMDGIQVLEKLEEDKNPLGGNASVVLLTNLGEDTLIARALSLGIRGYLVKSEYDPDQLAKEIKGYL